MTSCRPAGIRYVHRCRTSDTVLSEFSVSSLHRDSDEVLQSNNGPSLKSNKNLLGYFPLVDHGHTSDRLARRKTSLDRHTFRSDDHYNY